MLGLVLVAAVIAGFAFRDPGSYGGLNDHDLTIYLAAAAVAGLAYAAGVWLVRHRPAPGVMPVIIAAALLARAAVLVVPPLMSTDVYRYVWDGRVQASGINPYRYLPIDPALAALRDRPAYGDGSDPRRASDIFPNINRVDSAPTIYPPAAQALFLAVGLTAPSIWTMKAALLAFDLATMGIGLLLLRTAGRPAAHILVWAWNPLVIWEFAGAGHIDALAVAFVALAMLLAARTRQGWAGLAMGAAVATKLLPVVLFPAIWRRWDLRSPLAAVVLVILGYAAYSSVGLRVFGYLAGYAEEERLQDGAGFLALRLLRLAGPLPSWTGAAYVAAGLALLGGCALWVVRSPLPPCADARASVIARGALIMAAALIAVMSPHYPWYLTILVLPAILVPAWGALWPTIAGPLLYLDPSRDRVVWPALVFLPALVLLMIDLRARRPAPAAILVNGGT